MVAAHDIRTYDSAERQESSSLDEQSRFIEHWSAYRALA